MRLRLTGLILCSATGLLFGDDHGRHDFPHSREPILVREVRPEEARQAIIELLERSSDDRLKSSLPLVKNARITPSVVGGKWLDIGPWACFPAERRVSMMAGTPASYLSFRGDLEMSSAGKWRVTNLRGGYVCALPPPPPSPPMVPPAR
jgi:hypothetical protein